MQNVNEECVVIRSIGRLENKVRVASLGRGRTIEFRGYSQSLENREQRVSIVS